MITIILITLRLVIIIIIIIITIIIITIIIIVIMLKKKGNEAMRKMESESIVLGDIIIVLGDVIAQIPMISSLTVTSSLVHCSADENKYN